MKASLAGALIALQLLTAALVVGLLFRRNEPDPAMTAVADRIDRVATALEGALHRQAQISLYMDDLRQRWQAVPVPTATSASGAAPGTPPDGSAPAAAAGVASQGTPEATAPPVARSPFPVADAALAKLKHAVLSRIAERKANSTNLAPLDREVELCRDALIALGHHAVFVTRQEIDLQPFEKERSVDFVEYLLLEVVPPLSSGARSEAFDLARSALVRATNEPALKLAGAIALQQVDGEKWWKDVIDVAQLGTGREVALRCQLLGLFLEHPHPAVIDLCLKLLNEARYPPELRNQAIFVLAKQDSSAVNPALRSVIFEEPNHLMKNHAFDALWARLEHSPVDRAKLLEDVLAASTAQMPEALIVKATRLREEAAAGAADAKAGAAGN